MDNIQHLEGSGVRPAIVKRIFEKHQGRIWVESELYIGPKFFAAFQAANSNQGRKQKLKRMKQQILVLNMNVGNQEF